MEKGTISVMSDYSSSGVIEDEQGQMLDFDGGDIIGMDRSRMKEGDSVLFERQGQAENEKAVYIKLL